MSRSSRVSWQDGMFLLPHHFQQAERAAESHLQLRLEGLSAQAFGVLELSLNLSALAEGRLELERFKGILPDGTPVDIPQQDPAPLPRQLELSAGSPGVEVFLTLPVTRSSHTSITSSHERLDVRFVERSLEVGDEADVEKRRTIRVAEKQLGLGLSSDAPLGQVRLPLARVRLATSGGLELDPDFMPPCLRVRASVRLERLTRELVGVVAARARSLSAERRQRGDHILEPTEADLLSFLYLHSLNQHRLVLRHQLEQPDTHPAHLYEELSRLLGSLSSFSLALDEDLAPYNHLSPADAFLSLDRALRDALAQLFTTRYELIPLQVAENIWSGQIGDERLRASGEFYLAVLSALPPVELNSKMPTVCKIAERDSLRQAVNGFVDAVGVSGISRPPPGVPLRNDAVYFRIDTAHADWNQVRATGRISIYVPTWLGRMQLELIGVKAEVR